MNLQLKAPAETFVGQAELFDARESTGILKFPQADGSPSFTIDYGDGYTANLVATGHHYQRAGTYIISVTAKSIGGISTSITHTIIVRDIPQATAANTQNLPDSGGLNINGALLRDAINLAASRNNIAEQMILVPAGWKCVGPIITTKPVGDKWITIRTLALNMMPEGERVDVSDEQYMFQILSVDGERAFHGAMPADGTHHYRFQGMKVGQVDSTKYVHHLSTLGTYGGPYELENLAHHFIIDRCWFDGGPNDTDQIRTGCSIWADHVTICNSRFAEFRRIGGGVDCEGFGISIGQGPYSFINNHIVATSENVNLGAGGAAYRGNATITNPTKTSATLSNTKNLEVDMDFAVKVGGAYSAINSTIIRSINGNNVTFDEIATAPDNNSECEWEAQPSYIEFRRNHCFKPLKWFPRHPSWNGITYQIKNLYETKFSRYTVVDGNIFENTWSADQSYAIAISPRSTSGGESFASVVREMQWSNNIVKNAASGINLISSDGNSDPNSRTQRTTDITFRNMLFWNVGSGFDPGGAVHMLINMQNAYTRMKRFFFINITWDHGSPENQWQTISDFGTDGGADDSRWIHFVGQDGGYGFWSYKGVNFIDAIREFLPSGDTPSVNKNMIVNPNGHLYPEGTIIVDGDWPSQFVDYANGDFTLVAGSPGKNAGLDGKDLGVDMVALRYATRGCVSGVWDGTIPPEPPPPVPPPEPPPPTPPPPIPPPPVSPPTEEYKEGTFSPGTEKGRTALYQKMWSLGYGAYEELKGNKIKFRKFS